MVQGLKFLSKKGFHPKNLSNQKRVWEAEQETKLEQQRIQERERQLRREREDEELAQARGDTIKVSFLYQPPPGLDVSDKKDVDSKQSATLPIPEQKSVSNSAERTFATERQPGDDDAAAAFRRMLAGLNNNKSQQEEEEEEEDQQRATFVSTEAFRSTVLQGSTVDKSEVNNNHQDTAAAATLRPLEKAVGRRKESAAALTLDEQIQRFPALANAPRAKGMTATDVGVRFNPLGTQIRNVKCLACGVWGHSRGDRECSKTGWNPFASSSASASAQHIPKSNNKTDHENRKRSTEDREQKRYDSDSESHDSSSSSSSERRRRRRKRHKKKSKHRRSTHSYSDVDSDDDNDERSREAKKKSKRVKDKTRHGRSR